MLAGWTAVLKVVALLHLWSLLFWAVPRLKVLDKLLIDTLRLKIVMFNLKILYTNLSSNGIIRLVEFCTVLEKNYKKMYCPKKIYNVSVYQFKIVISLSLVNIRC